MGSVLPLLSVPLLSSSLCPVALFFSPEPEQHDSLAERNGQRRETVGGEQRPMASCWDKPAKTRVCEKKRATGQREEEECRNQAARTKGRKFHLINFFLS